MHVDATVPTVRIAMRRPEHCLLLAVVNQSQVQQRHAGTWGRPLAAHNNVTKAGSVLRSQLMATGTPHCQATVLKGRHQVKVTGDAETTCTH